MLELSLLGLQALRGADGRELGNLPAQPKRFALLAYLAIGAGEGYHRRDSLAAMFWPELDQFAARRALRNTLYHLREALGDGVIVAQGDDAVRIDPQALTCDVTRLADAVARGRHEEAVGWYHGELLAGLHFANAGEAFEEWLSGERRRVRELVLRALRALMERDEAAGNSSGAAWWAQRALLLAPEDESWLRRTMALLAKSGDTGGALRIYESFARRLSSELNAKPSAETEALARRIREGIAVPTSAATAVAPAAEASPASSVLLPGVPSVPMPSGSDTRDGAARGATLETPMSGGRRAWRARVSTRGALAVLGVGGAIGLALLVAHGMGGGRPHPGGAPPRVLITVFDNRTGDPSLQPLGRMTQDWLAQGIVRAQLADVVDPRAVYVQGRAAAGAAVDPMTIARRTGATIVVSGSYYRAGDTLYLQAAVVDVATERVMRAVGPLLGSARAPVSTIDALRSRVMTALASVVDVRATQDLEASDEIPPYDAYQAYVEGWDAYWHGDGPTSEALFLRAARLDSAFAAASLAAATAAANYSDCPLTDSIARALEAQPNALDRVQALSLGIETAKCDGRNDEMLRLALERADIDTLNSSSQMAAAAAALWANRPRLTVALLQRVNPATDLAWSSDSTHLAYWSDLTEALHLLGRYREELAAADRVSPAAPLARAWMRARALAALSRPTAALALLDSALALPVETSSYLGLAPYTEGRPQYTATPAWVADGIARELAVHGDTVAARQAARRAVAWYRGRPAEERATPEERLVASWSLEVLGDYPGAERMARALVAQDSADVDYRGELAGLAAERGDTALADSLDRWLAVQPVSRVGWTASVYRARVAALLGRADSAVARTREARDEGAWPYWIHEDPALAALRSRADFLAVTAPRD